MEYRKPSLPPLPEEEDPQLAEGLDDRRSSNNPYRQGHGSGMFNPDFLSSGDRLSSGERVKAPVRAVFTDLSAAHSNITAGKKRSSSTSAKEERDSIPLQDMSPTDRPADYFPSMALPQLPAISFSAPRGRSSSSQVDDHLVHSSAWLKQRLPESSSSILNNVKSAIASISSPQMEKREGPVTARWPKPSPGFERNDKQERSSIIEEGGRSANVYTKPQVKRYSVGPAHPANLNGSSVYQSSPPVGDTVHPLLSRHGYAHSSYGSESVQCNDTRDREYSVASGRHPFLDQSYIQAPRRPMHSSNPSEIPDGSTVGNIVNEYLQSKPLHDFSEGDDDDDEPFGLSLPELKPGIARTTNSTASTATDRSLPSALSQRLEARSNRYNRSAPPEYSLPKLPAIPGRTLAPSSTHLGQSSSYGDTRVLLNLTEPSNLRIQRDLSCSDSEQGRQSIDSVSDKSASPLQARNPYGMTPRVMLNGEDDSHVVYDHDSDYDVGRPAMPRKPLHSDVSDALRRQSVFSTYSTGSIDDSIVDNYRWFGQGNPSTAGSRTPQKKGSNVRRHSRRHSGDIADHSRGMPEQMSSFYTPGAVSSSWVRRTSQGTEVRVPIIRRLSRQPKQVNHHYIVDDQDDDEDEGVEEQGDWETVGESGFGTEASVGFIGGIKRTGDSIANVTDDGNTPDFDNFGSTNRVPHHPDHPQYASEYRQRDLKGSQVPVFAPVYREHKVNGYLNDSTRTRPQPTSSGYLAPPSLGRTHPNPFSSPPPQVLPSKSLANRGMGIGMFRSKLPNHFKPSVQTLCTEIVEADHDDEPKPVMTEEERDTWMRDFSKHKLTLSTENEFLKDSPTKSRPSSWQREIEMAADGAVSEFNSMSSGKTKGNAASSSKMRPVSSGKRIADQLAKIKPSNKRESASKAEISMSPIPAKAMYQDIDGSRAKYEQQARRAVQRQTSKVPAPKHPTNKLRELKSSSTTSLLPRPLEPRTASNLQMPLRTLRRSSWRDLYTPEQLRDMEAGSGVDRMARLPEGLSHSSLFSDNTSGGGRRFVETPTLRHWRRESSFVDEKTTCSIVVLCSCSWFPPLLLLFIMGYLDPIIEWWTSGRFLTYSRKQRFIGFWLLVTWGVVILCGLVGVIVYYIIKLRPR